MNATATINPEKPSVWDMHMRAIDARAWLHTRVLQVRETWNSRTVWWGNTLVQAFDRQPNDELKQTHQLIAQSADRTTSLSWDVFPCYGDRRRKPQLKWCVRLGIAEDGGALGGCCSFDTEDEARACFDRYAA